MNDPQFRNKTRTRTTVRLSLVIERVEESNYPGPPSTFPRARKTIDTTGETVSDSELPPSHSAMRSTHSNVYPFAARRVG